MHSRHLHVNAFHFRCTAFCCDFSEECGKELTSTTDRKSVRKSRYRVVQVFQIIEESNTDSSILRATRDRCTPSQSFVNSREISFGEKSSFAKLAKLFTFTFSRACCPLQIDFPAAVALPRCIWEFHRRGGTVPPVPPSLEITGQISR